MNYRLPKILCLIISTLAFVFIVVFYDITSVSAQSVQPGYGYVNSRIGLNVRSSYSILSRKVAGLKDNTKVQIDEIVFTSKSSTASNNIWYHVKYGNKSGYVRSDYIDGVTYAAVSGRTVDSLNCRKGAGTGFSRITTFGKNVNLTILMNARSSSSNVKWYMIKYNGSYAYVCSSWVNVTGSIFSNNNGGTSNDKGASSAIAKSASTGSNIDKNKSKKTTNTSANTSNQSDDFEYSIKNFPEDYKVKLRALHKLHPNWQFVAKNTGLDWNTALAKESRNGVSLINYAYPLSYRDTSSYSFVAKDSKRTLYGSPSTSSNVVGYVSANTEFTILDEVFTANKNSDEIKYVHVKTSDGRLGYIKNSVTNESYNKAVTGVVQGLTNVRSGAGTAFNRVGSMPNKSKVEIVLESKASDGVVWYKIKRNNGFAYICSQFVTDIRGNDNKTNIDSNNESAVTSNTISGNVKNSTSYRRGPSELFGESGRLSIGQTVSIISKVKNIDNREWYKVAINGYKYYVPIDSIDIANNVKADDAEVMGKTNDYLNYRLNYSTGGRPAGMLGKNKSVVITGAVKSDKYVWYRLKIDNKDYYAASNWITLTDSKFEDVKGLNKNTQLSGSGDVSKLSGLGKFISSGKYIPKDGSTWFNAHPNVIAYYMDPRNFINDNNIYMFEDLSYKPYQSSIAVAKILGGSALATNGFQASWFMGAGQQNGISPISLAARARQETGGGSIAISGYRIGVDTYYNPYNIGAYSDANPVMRGLEYAKSQGWNTKEKAVYGGAKFIADGYIKRGQNSIYYQRFNVANGANYVGTHQYMTNVSACYTESNTTKTSYASYGITNEALVFEIPIFTNMPSSTSLPH